MCVAHHCLDIDRHFRSTRSTLSIHTFRTFLAVNTERHLATGLCNGTGCVLCAVRAGVSYIM
jgi:hypothetical protein